MARQSINSGFDLRNLQSLTCVQYQLSEPKRDPYQFESKQQARARQNKEAIETLQNFYQQFLGISISDLSEEQQYYHDLDRSVAQGISEYNGEQVSVNVSQSFRDAATRRIPSQVTRRTWNPRTKDAEQVDLDFDNYPPLRILGGLAAQRSYKVKQRMAAKLLQLYTATKFSGPRAFELIKEMFIKRLKDDEERARRREEEERLRVLEWKRRKKELVMKYYESEDDSDSPAQLQDPGAPDGPDGLRPHSTPLQPHDQIESHSAGKSEKKLNNSLIKSRKGDDEQPHIYKYGSSAKHALSRPASRGHVKKINVSGLAARILEVQDEIDVFHEREYETGPPQRYSRGGSRQSNVKGDSPQSRKQSRINTAQEYYKQGSRPQYQQVSSEQESEDPKLALGQKRNEEGPRRGRGDAQISRPPSTMMKGGKLSRKSSKKSRKSSRYGDNFQDKDSEYTVSYIVMDQHASRHGSAGYGNEDSYISEEEEDGYIPDGQRSRKDKYRVERTGSRAYRKNDGEKKRISSKRHSQVLNTSPTDQFTKKSIRGTRGDKKESISIAMSQESSYYTDELTSITTDTEQQTTTDGKRKYVHQKGENFKHNKVLEHGDTQKAKEIHRALKQLANRKFFSAENIDQALEELEDTFELEKLDKQIKYVQKSLLRMPLCSDYYLIRNFRCTKGRQPSLSAYQMASLFILFCLINKERVPMKTILLGLTKAQFSNDEIFEISKEVRRIQADYQGNKQLEIPEKEKKMQQVAQWRNDKISPEDLNQLDLSQNSSFSHSSAYYRQQRHKGRDKSGKSKHITSSSSNEELTDMEDGTALEDRTGLSDSTTRGIISMPGEENSSAAVSGVSAARGPRQRSGRSEVGKARLGQLGDLMAEQGRLAEKRRREEARATKRREKEQAAAEAVAREAAEAAEREREAERAAAAAELQAALEAERARLEAEAAAAAAEAAARPVLSERDLLALQLSQFFDPVALRYERNRLTRVYHPTVPRAALRSHSANSYTTPSHQRDFNYATVQLYRPEVPAYYDTFRKNHAAFFAIFGVDYDLIKERYSPPETFHFDHVYDKLIGRVDIPGADSGLIAPILETYIDARKFDLFYNERVESTFHFDSLKARHFSVQEKHKPERAVSMPQMLYDYSSTYEDLSGSKSSTVYRPTSRDGKKVQRVSFAQIQQQKQAEIAKENMKKIYKQKASIIRQIQRTNIFEWTYQPLVEKAISDDQNTDYTRQLKHQRTQKTEYTNKRCMPIKQSQFRYVMSLDDYKLITDTIRLKPSGKRRRSKSVDFTKIQSLSHRLNRKILLQTYNDSFQFNAYKIDNQQNMTLQQIQSEIVTMNKQLDSFDDSILNQKYIVNEDEKTYQIITAQQFGGIKHGFQMNSGFYLTNEQQVLPSSQLFDDQWLFGGFETFRNYGTDTKYGIISYQQITLESAIQGLNENSLKNFKELPQPLISPPPSFDEASVHKDLVFSTPYDLEQNARHEQLKIDRYIARQERLFQRRAAVGKAEESKLYLEKKKRIEQMIEARKKLQKSFLEFPNELLQIILVQDSAEWILSKYEGIFQVPKYINYNDNVIPNNLGAKKFLKITATQPVFHIQPIAVMNIQRYLGNTQITLIGNIKYIIKFQAEKIFYEKLEKLKEYTFNFNQQIYETYETAANVFFHFYQQPSMEKMLVLSENEENWEHILFKKLNAAQEAKKVQLEQEMKEQEEFKANERRKREEKVANETQSIIQNFMDGEDEQKMAKIMLLNAKNDLNITKIDINKQIQLGEKETVYKFYHKLNDFAFSCLVLKQQLIKQMSFKGAVADWAVPFTVELDYGEMNDKKQRLFYGLAGKSLIGESNCGIAHFCKGVGSAREFHRKNLLQALVAREATAVPKNKMDSAEHERDVNGLGLSPVQQAMAREKERLLRLKYKAEVEELITRPVAASRTLMRSLEQNDGAHVLQYAVTRSLMAEAGALEDSSEELEPTHGINQTAAGNSQNYQLSRQDSLATATSTKEQSESSFNIVQLGSNRSKTSSTVADVMKPIARAASPTMRRNLLKSGQSTRVQIELKRIQSRGTTKRSPMKPCITLDELKSQKSSQDDDKKPEISPPSSKTKYNNAISVMEANKSKKPLRSPNTGDDEEIKLRVVSRQLTRARVSQQ